MECGNGPAERSGLRHKRVCLVSHRLGGYDGVSIEAARWHRAFRRLGWSVTRAAGYFADEPMSDDVVVTGLWAPTFGSEPPEPDIATIAGLCRSHDLLVIDNAGSLPTTPETAAVLEEQALRAGIPTIVRHHDPPWQSTNVRHTADHRLPLRDPRMLHVTINRLTESEFRYRFPDLDAAQAITTIYNTVDTEALSDGRRWATRRRMRIGDGDILLVHPARNVARKNVPAAMELAGALAGALAGSPHRRVHYWLTDPSGEIGTPADGVTVHRGHCTDSASLYAASDLVVLPSLWEGWGLPVVEAAAARRPVVTHPYPVLEEIHRLGIETVDHRDVGRITELLGDPSMYRALTTANARKAAALDIRHSPAILSRAAARATELARSAPAGAVRTDVSG